MLRRILDNLSFSAIARSITFGCSAFALFFVTSSKSGAGMLASSLPVEIRGVITSSDPRACVALLQDIDRGKLIAVKAGYFIFDNVAKVVSITSNKSGKTVVIDRGNNQLEYLGDKPAGETAEPAPVTAPAVVQ